MMTDGLMPTTPLQTWLHRIPAGFKLAAMVLASLLLLPVDDWRILAGALAMVLAIYAGFGRAGMARLALLRPLVPLLVIVGGVQAFSSGWHAGAVVSLRLLTLLLLADLVSMTTPMSALMAVLAPVFGLLRPLGVNPRKMALAVALVLRFVPVLLTRWRAREEAWKARTHRRVPVRLVAVFLADILQLADRVAESLDARGFDAAATERQHKPS
jgi:biotin transport system permease protein